MFNVYKAALLGGALVAASAGSALAVPVYDTDASGFLTGTRSTPAASGIEINGGNATSATLSWVITGGAGSWHYKYTMNYASQQAGMSHFILDLSDNCTSATNGCVSNVIGSTTQTYGTFVGGPGNPGFTGSITGIKFDGLGSGNDGDIDFLLEFDSNRAPVWGDFYAKNGNATSNGISAENTGANNHASESILDFIARPDTTGGSTPGGGGGDVPEPAMLGLFGAALAGLGLIRRRRRA